MSEQKKQQCARCGSCTVVCPVYRVTGRESLTARAKLHLLDTELAASPSSHFEDLFAQCLLCGACEDVCPRDIQIRKQVIAARARFSTLYGRHGLQKSVARFALARPSLLEGLLKAGAGLESLSLIPVSSGLRIKLGLLEKKDTDKNHESPRKESCTQLVHDSSPISYFPGCHARYVQPSVCEATRKLSGSLTGAEPCEPSNQTCCGLAAWSTGKKEEAQRLARQNMEAFSDSTGPVLTSCASCAAHLRSYRDLFEGEGQWQERAENFSYRVQELSTFMLDRIQDATFRSPDNRRIWYHEPCHLRFDSENDQAVRQLLELIENVELVQPDEEQLCCGQGGLFHLDYPAVSDAVFSQVYNSFARHNPELVVTGCSGCLMQWQAGLAVSRSKAQATHLAVLLADCIDIDP